jgi:hypothetical protein
MTWLFSKWRETKTKTGVPDFSNALYNIGSKLIFFWHTEGSTFPVTFSMLQINNNLTARCFCSFGCLVLICMYSVGQNIYEEQLKKWLSFWDSLMQGSMLWSQFSAIFDNFRRKNWRFYQNQCYDQNFAYFRFVLSQKRQFFRLIFRRKYLKNHNIGPRLKPTLVVKLLRSCWEWSTRQKRKKVEF